MTVHSASILVIHTAVVEVVPQNIQIIMNIIQEIVQVLAVIEIVLNVLNKIQLFFNFHLF